MLGAARPVLLSSPAVVKTLLVGTFLGLPVLVEQVAAGKARRRADTGAQAGIAGQRPDGGAPRGAQSTTGQQPLFGIG